jgi:hypothetical protein
MTTDWMRRGAAALALARTALGLAALAWPSLIARPWVGRVNGPAARVFGRALGGRDIALGLGALAALAQVPPVRAGSAGAWTSAGAWVGAGALADSLDLLGTAAAWDELPPAGRWLVAATAGGAAAAGGAATWSLLSGKPADGA